MVAVGVVGLGNMGSALAANLVGAGFAVVGHDAAGPDRAHRPGSSTSLRSPRSGAPPT